MLSVLWVPVFTSVAVLAIRSVSASAHFTEGPAPFDGGVRGVKKTGRAPALLQLPFGVRLAEYTCQHTNEQDNFKSVHTWSLNI